MARPPGAGDRRDRALADAEAKSLGMPTSPAPQPLPQAEPAMDAVKRLFGSIRHNVNGVDQKGPPR